ncbi:unnamed protein product, partial [Lymnaea stagnalis]
NTSAGTSLTEIRVGPATKKGVSLLTNINVAATTSTSSLNASGSITSTSSASTGRDSPLSKTVTQVQIPATSSGPVTSNTQTNIDTAGKIQQSPQQQQSAFPDLNSMWQSNFGSGPPSASHPSQSGAHQSQGGAHPPQGGSQAASSTPSGMGTNISNSNSYSGGMMMSNPSLGGMGAVQDNSNDDSSSSSANQNLMTGGSHSQNQIGSFGNQHISGSQGYNNMSNPYIQGSMGPYGMGHSQMVGQSHMPPYMSGMHTGFMPSPPGSFSQSLPPPPDQMQNQQHQGGSNMMYGSTGNPSQFGPSYGHNQQNPPPFGSTASGNSFHSPTNSSFGFNSDMGGMNYGAPTTSSSFMPNPQGDQGYPQSQTNMPSNYHHPTSPPYGRESSGDNFSSQSQPQQNPMSSTSSSQNPSTSSNKPRGTNKTPSPAPSPRHTTHTPDTSKSFMDISNSRPNNNTHSNSSTTNSQSYSSGGGPDVDSLSSSLNFPNYDSGPGLSSGFSSYCGPNMSSGLLGHSLGSDIGMGGSAFRAHQSPANPQPFRLDGAGGISGMGNTGLNYNSGMSAFSSPSGLGAAGGYSNPSTFGGFGTGYSGSSSLPFSSSPIMPPPPQSMMGYSQPPLGYPSMSPLMMGGPAPPAPASMGGSMWPIMPSSMMGGSYGYPPHPSSMGFPSGLDSQGFGHLGPGPNN